MNTENVDRLLSAVDSLLARYLLTSADGEPRPLRYNPLDYQTLKYIEHYPGSRATDIGRVLHLPPTTLQSALDRLVRMELIEKTPHPTDGRARIYNLTSKGRTLRERILVQDRANMAEVLSPLSAREQTQLLDLMGKAERSLRRA